MLLIIQVPCLNEEETLRTTLDALPRSIPGVDLIEFLVIDDGSSDRTVEVAREAGAHHILSLGSNRGLARAFSAGLNQALALGADIVVNTDADNQYCADDIAKLIQPVLENRADIVVGCRPIREHTEFSPLKKSLQLIGSSLLRLLSKTTVRDATSGFRAFSREACQRLFIYTSFSYCTETLIQAGNSGLRVESVDVRVNPKTRESRLFRNLPEYLWKQGSTMFMMFVLYRAGSFFLTVATGFALPALIIGIRFMVNIYVLDIPHRTFLPSLILCAMLGLTAVCFAGLALLGELLKSQRKLTEETIYLLRKRQPPRSSAATAAMQTPY